MTPSLRRTPVPGVWGTEAIGRTLRTLRWSSSMRSARQVATDRRHTFGAAATGRAMRSNQNNSVSVCNRVTMPLTSPGVESAARAITKRKRRLDSSMAVLKLDSWAHLGEPGAGYADGALVKALPPTGGLVSWHTRPPELTRRWARVNVRKSGGARLAAVINTGVRLRRGPPHGGATHRPRDRRGGARVSLDAR